MPIIWGKLTEMELLEEQRSQIGHWYCFKALVHSRPGQNVLSNAQCQKNMRYIDYNDDMMSMK